MDMYEMLSSRATYVIGLQLICASRNASRLNLAVLVFCTFAMIIALRLELYTLSFQSSTKVGQGHSEKCDLKAAGTPSIRGTPGEFPDYRPSRHQPLERYARLPVENVLSLLPRHTQWYALNSLFATAFQDQPAASANLVGLRSGDNSYSSKIPHEKFMRV